MSATLTEPASPPATPARTGAWVRPLLLALGAFGALVLFAAAMTRTVTYDEDQYIAAGVMVAQGMLPYRDFAYLQAPLYPVLLGALFKLSGGWYLLAGRLLTFALSLTSAALLWHILRRLGAGRTLAAILLAACLTSPFLASTLANTRNDALPLALMLAGLALHLAARDDRWATRFAAALVMGLAVEAKVSYLFGPLALGIHALFAPRQRLPPVLAGTLLAALPALVLFALAPETVRFGILDFHLVAPADWYGRQGLGDMLAWPARAEALIDWMVLGGNLTLLVLSLALSAVTMARKRKWKRPGQLLIGLLLGALLFAFIPSPAWAMYYAALAPLLACCIAHLDRITVNLADPRRKTILFLTAALPVIPVLMLHAPELLRTFRGDWVGLEAHRTAAAIRAALPRPGPVATLFPLLVLDANPVPVEFVSGPFIYRSGDLWRHEELARLHATSPATLEATLDRLAPAGIFAGAYATAFRTPMDAALTRYAESRDWRLVYADPSGARLWVPP